MFGGGEELLGFEASHAATLRGKKTRQVGEVVHVELGPLHKAYCVGTGSLRITRRTIMKPFKVSSSCHQYSAFLFYTANRQA